MTGERVAPEDEVHEDPTVTTTTETTVEVPEEDTDDNTDAEEKDEA